MRTLNNLEAKISARLKPYYVARRAIGGGLKPFGPSHCILNALRVLFSGRNTIYLRPDEYPLAGISSHDPRVIESPLGRVVTMMGFASHRYHFNFCFTGLKDVKVLPKKEGKGETLDMKVWRRYHLIRDNELAIPFLDANLDKESFRKLQESKFVGEREIFRPNKTYRIDFRGVPFVSSNWARPRVLGLANLLSEERELKAIVYTLKKELKKKKPNYSPTANPLNIYLEHVSPQLTLPVRQYTISCVEIRLMGYKPSEYDFADLSATEIIKLLHRARHRLLVVRYLSRSICYALEKVDSKVITWSEGKSYQRGRYLKREQTARFSGVHLKRVTWKETILSSLLQVV